jgi:hypothetical protein
MSIQNGFLPVCGDNMKNKTKGNIILSIPFVIVFILGAIKIGLLLTVGVFILAFCIVWIISYGTYLSHKPEN